MPRVAQGWYKSCLNCGKDIYVTPSQDHKKYCSKTCHSLYKCSLHFKNPIKARTPTYKEYRVRTFTCKVCNKTITERRPSNLKTCSRECGSQLTAKAKKEKRYNTVCSLCGVSISICPSRYKKNHTGNFFCCSAHANEYQGRNKIEYACETCGNKFKRSPCWERYGKPQRYCSHECTHKHPSRRAKLIEMNLMQQQGKRTRLEEKGYEMLNSLGLLYFQQYMINSFFCVDAFVFSANLVIQFDGDYWHGHPEKFPNPDSRQKERMWRDKGQDTYLRKHGYQIIRIWESEMNTNPAAVKEKILIALQPQKHKQKSPN